MAQKIGPIRISHHARKTPTLCGTRRASESSGGQTPPEAPKRGFSSASDPRRARLGEKCGLILLALCLPLCGAAVPNFSDDTAEGGGAAECVLSAIQHSYSDVVEYLTLSFSPAGQKTAGATPHYKALYLELSSRLIVSLQKTTPAVGQTLFCTPLISSVEVKRDGETTEVHIRTRRAVKFAVSEENGSLTIAIADVSRSRYWLRIDAPTFNSVWAATPLRALLAKAGVQTLPLNVAAGRWTIACAETFSSLKDAQKKAAALQALVDSITASDLSIAFAATVAVDFGSGREGGEKKTLPAEDEKIDALIQNLSLDPADLDADIKDKVLSKTCAEILKRGANALPSLMRGAYSADENVRRSSVYLLTQMRETSKAAILDAAADKDPAIRTEVILALKKLGMDMTLLPAFKAALSDANKWVKIFAAFALANAYAPEGIRALIDFIDDDEACDEAVETLHSATGRQFSEEGPGGMDAEKRKALKKEWLHWWESEGAKGVFPAERDWFYKFKNQALARVLQDGDEAGIEEVKIRLLVTSPLNEGRVSEYKNALLVTTEEGRTVLAVFDDVEEDAPQMRWMKDIATGDLKPPFVDARLFAFDVDGDGTDEFMLLLGCKSQTEEKWEASIFRLGDEGFDEIFRGTLSQRTVENAEGIFPKSHSSRLLLSLNGSAAEMPDILARKIDSAGTGENTKITGTNLKIKWNGKEYEMEKQNESAHAASTPSEAPSAPQTPADSTASRSKMEIVVSKADAVLIVFKDGKEFKRYPVKLGAAKGDKEIEGDEKTPEGEFYICLKNPTSRYHKSLGLSYPNIEDAERGLKNGLIIKEEHDKIVEAIKRRGIPPWKTKLGGEIFIHGEAESREATKGCIALFNKDIEELYSLVPTGTKVEIRP